MTEAFGRQIMDVTTLRWYLFQAADAPRLGEVELAVGMGFLLLSIYLYVDMFIVGDITMLAKSLLAYIVSGFLVFHGFSKVKASWDIRVGMIVLYVGLTLLGIVWAFIAMMAGLANEI